MVRVDDETGQAEIVPPVPQRSWLGHLNWAVLGLLLLLLGGIAGGIGYRIHLHDHWEAACASRGASLSWSEPKPKWPIPYLEPRVAEALLRRPVSLTIKKSLPSDDLARLLAELPPLKRVSVRKGEISTRCLEVLAQGHHLTSFQFSKPVLTAEDARWLTAMPDLEHLAFFGNLPAGARNDWSWARNRPGLTLHLDLKGATDEDVGDLGSVPSVQRLTISGEGLTGACLAPLAKHSKLAVLQITAENLQLDPETLHWPAQLGSLKLTCPAATDATLKTLSGLSQLEELELHRGHVSDGGMIALVQLPALRVLTLDELPLTDVGMQILSKSHRLERITLNKARVTAKGIVQLSEMRRWNRILFNGVKFESNPPSTPLPLDLVRHRIGVR